jgi:hypothetical protein
MKKYVLGFLLFLCADVIGQDSLSLFSDKNFYHDTSNHSFFYDTLSFDLFHDFMFKIFLKVPSHEKVSLASNSGNICYVFNAKDTLIISDLIKPIIVNFFCKKRKDDDVFFWILLKNTPTSYSLFLKKIKSKDFTFNAIDNNNFIKTTLLLESFGHEKFKIKLPKIKDVIEFEIVRRNGTYILER